MSLVDPNDLTAGVHFEHRCVVPGGTRMYVVLRSQIHCVVTSINSIWPPVRKECPCTSANSNRVGTRPEDTPEAENRLGLLRPLINFKYI